MSTITTKELADVPALVNKIINGTRSINDLELKYQEHENVALTLLRIRPAMARKFDLKNAEQKSVIIKWVKDSTSDFKTKIKYLDPDDYMSEDSYDNDILAIFIEKALANNLDDRNEPKDFKTLSSFAGETVIKFNYETLDGEEMVYNDRLLNLPISLFAKASLSLKITNNYNFLKFIDVNPQQINKNIIYAKLVTGISSALRSVVLSVIEEHNLCYYEINKYYDEISNKVVAYLNRSFVDTGLFLSEFYLLNISIPNETDKIFEQNRIKFMQLEQELELKHKAELLALENYEKKAEIHDKHPTFEFGLTEKEKDNAVERYLTKKNGTQTHEFKQTKNVNKRERSISLGKINDLTEGVDQKDSIVEEKKSINFTIIFGAIGAIFMLIGIVVAVLASPIGGCIVLAIGILIMGVVVAKLVNDKKKEMLYENIPLKPLSIDTPSNDSTENN